MHLGAARLEAQVAQRTGELLQRTNELRVAKDAAEAANRAKTTFLANMSHELRTPLNAILGFSNLLREGDVSEKQRNDLDIINRSGEHLLESDQRRTGRRQDRGRPQCRGNRSLRLSATWCAKLWK